MILIIITILLTLWILKEKSINNFFYQSPEVLAKKFELFEKIVQDFNFTNPRGYSEAYCYFMELPHKYDGSTIVQDRWLMSGLEPQSMKHDYDWIHAKTLTDYFKSNQTYATDLRKSNTNWFTAYGYLIGLHIISPFHYVITKKIKL